jgi:predicted amidophosphoribosyltransferase
MAHGAASGHARPTVSEKERVSMRLFKRTTSHDDAVRCPECGERLPRGAADCAMCGLSLTDSAHDAVQADPHQSSLS